MLQFAFFGCFAGGSLIWGGTAKQIGIPLTLAYSGIGMLIGSLALSRCRVNGISDLKLTLLGYPLSETQCKVSPDEGPVLVTVEHCIHPRDFRDFEIAMQAVRSIRLRDGATHWWLFHDLAKPGRYVETFIVKSWAEHLRQHERMTITDYEVEQYARSYHLADKPLVVAHLIAADHYSRQAVAES